MKSVRTYLIILAVAVSIFIVLWLITYTNYTNLEINYANLQNQYSSLQNQYSNLQSNYTNLKTNYSNLQSLYIALQAKYNLLESNYTTIKENYSTLQNQYQTLQNQYSSLQNQYSNLQSQYNNLNNIYSNILVFLGQDNISDGTLLPGYFAHPWVVVPNGFSGTIYITVSASSPVEVYVLDLSNLIQAAEGYSYEYYLYDQGTYINDQVTVGPGLYIIAIYNPSNSLTVSYSATITTTYTQIS
jgi:chaperonin cofactor prefoldin